MGKITVKRPAVFTAATTSNPACSSSASTSKTSTEAISPVIRAPSWSWAAVDGPVAQVSFSPPSVTRHRDLSYNRIQPVQGNLDRWTHQSIICGLQATHIPTCELRLLGRLVLTRIVSRPILDYSLAKGNRRMWQNFVKPQFGVLLERDSNRSTEKEIAIGSFIEEGNWKDTVVAVGSFDIEDERCEEVWCLQIVQYKGLMLKREANGKYSRLGSFYYR